MEPPDQPQGEGIARPRAWWTSVLLSLFLAAVGWVALQYRELLWPRQGDEVIDYQEKGMSWSQGFSYDVPFLVRQSLPSWFGPLGNPPRQVLDEVVVIYMDDESNRRLEQIQSCIWSRKLHARLLDRLTLDGPRAVMFDAFFDSETPEDAAFAEAMRKNGRVFLGVAIEMNSDAPLTLLEQARFNAVGLTSERLTKRNQTLYSAALGWGVLTFRPMESDYGVRRLFVGKPREGNDPWPAVTWVMAQHFNAGMPLDEGSRFARRWVNYYGPSGVIQGISYYRLLTENAGVPAGYFRDKIVIIGSRSGFASQANRRLDEFSTPWSRFRGRVTTPGAEVHATMLLNLLHHDWLERVSPATERWFVVLLGLALGALWWLRPGPAALVLALVALVVFAVSCWMQWQDRRWWNWTVPVVVQIPVAFVVTVASRYYVEASHRRKLRQAAEIYLSPDLVKQISDDTFSLKPGGKKVVATLVFTDIEAFSKLSEKLDDPDRLSRVLIDYFT
ncbi:MAG TPA: CHASE2 domain-containing protein, partial [Lacunisphaera sp.]|nr:CHASE2 domain-containing protein [Lacunisphaera sp.]